MVGTEVERALDGLEVAITGKLASMSRDEALKRIASTGGRYAASPTESTALLVVGQGGPPLGEDGRLTAHLREARSLQAAGAALRIVAEEEFLALIGLEERQEDLHRLYTTAQLARMLDVPAGRIRAWVRHELLQPVKVVRRLCFFDFRQVAGVKALSRLTADGVKPQRIRRSLMELEGWWPEAAESLAQLEAVEQGSALVVRTREGALAETSGQLRLEFEHPTEATDAESDDAPADDDAQAELWFRRGVVLEEEERPEEAVVAYAKALGFGTPRPELAFNLGNVLYAIDRMEEAAQCFALATEIDAEYVEAWNNLGNALGEGSGYERACEAFRRALAIASDYADAHFNLAEALAAHGELEEAREHWQAYLEQDPHSVWADEVRARLRRTR